MRFQKRDGEILKAIYDNEGVLARRQIKDMFWPNSTQRAMEKRLTKLFQAGYINIPSPDQRRQNPIPEPICWLGVEGAKFMAGIFNANFDPLKGTGEYQLRKLKTKLRDQGVRWVRVPRWSLLRHDLAIVDFRMALEKAVNELPNFELGRWMSESIFRLDPDMVEYEIQDKNGNRNMMKKGVIPDAFFEIVNEERQNRGEPHRAMFLLELDMSSHDPIRFGREKVAPGIAYIKSNSYLTRFNRKFGHWIVATSGGERRLRNLMRQTKINAGNEADLFFFTLLANVEGGNVLTSPIWLQVGSDQPRSLING